MKMSSGFTNKVIEAKENRTPSESIKKSVATHPLKSGGSNFKTHKLKKVTPWKYVYKPSIGAIIFAGLFTAIGFGIILFNSFGFVLKKETFSEFNLFLILFGSVFAFSGGIILYLFAKPRVFNKKTNLYYKSYKKPTRVKSIEKHQLPLTEVIALQIIGEHVKSEDSTYKSFELNLVISDGTRRNVIDHENLKSIIRDAQELEIFLKIPIWHATSHLENQTTNTVL